MVTTKAAAPRSRTATAIRSGMFGRRMRPARTAASSATACNSPATSLKPEPGNRFTMRR